MSITLAWLFVLLGSVAVGLAAVALLVTSPRFEPAAAAVALLSATGAAWGLFVLAGRYGALPPVAAAAGLGLLAAAGGYGLGASLLPLLVRQAQPAPVDRPKPAPTDDVAVVLLSCAEPERYTPQHAAALVAEVADSEQFVPMVVTPFLFAAYKARYRMAEGRSPARETVHGISQRLASKLELPQVRLAWCDPPGSLSETVASVVESGYRRIVILTLSVAEGRYEERSKEALQELHLKANDARIVYAEALWASDVIAELVAGRVRQYAGGTGSIGVVLVVRGQPPAWEEAHPGFDRFELAFAERVRDLLTESGLREEWVRMAWTDWRSPDVTEAVRHLGALGCERVAVVPTSYPTESLVTMLDLPRATEVARAEAEVDVLPPWGNDDAVAEELAVRARRAMKELS